MDLRLCEESLGLSEKAATVQETSNQGTDAYSS